MLRNNHNSYINCSEQQAHSRSVTLKYACIIIVIVIIISSSSNCAKVCGSAALCGSASGSMLAVRAAVCSSRHLVGYVCMAVRVAVCACIEVLEKLGIRDKPAQQKVQSSMARIAATHLNRIVPHQYRRLCARQNKCINANKTGVG